MHANTKAKAIDYCYIYVDLGQDMRFNFNCMLTFKFLCNFQYFKI